MGFPRQEYEIVISSSRGSSRCRDRIWSSVLQADSLPSEPPGKSWWKLFFSIMMHQFSSVHLLSHVWLFATPWIAAHQASLSITNSRSSLKLMSIELVMPSSHLILCHPLLLLSPIPPSSRVFSNESTLRMRWPKYWSFSFSISPSKDPTLNLFNNNMGLKYLYDISCFKN